MKMGTLRAGALAVSAALLMATATPQVANAGKKETAIALGILGGIIVGGAIANSQPRYRTQPVYQAQPVYQQRCWTEKRWEWDPYVGANVQRLYRVCQ